MNTDFKIFIFLSTILVVTALIDISNDDKQEKTIIMEDKYFVIHNGDGDTTVREYTKEKLVDEIEEGAWGDAVALEDIPDNSYDTNYWGGDLLIIKGKIVTPKPKEVVTKYELD